MTDLDKVLRAPQPLDAWSRAQWEPLARKLGPKPFLEATFGGKRTDTERMRAVEVATELFDGLPLEKAEYPRKNYSPAVEARIVWSLGRKFDPKCQDLLSYIVRNASDSRVMVRAIEALTDHAADPDIDPAWGSVLEGLASSNKRIRQAAAYLEVAIERARANGPKVSKRPDDYKPTKEYTPDAALTLTLISQWRLDRGEVRDENVRDALDCLIHTPSNENELDAIRLLILSLGDFNLKNPPAEAYGSYSLNGPLKGREKEIGQASKALRRRFPSGDEHLDVEAARFLAMVEDDDDAIPAKVAAMWTPQSSATLDMHFLIVYSRLRGKRDDKSAEQVADAILSLDPKLEGQAQRNKQNWNARLVEILPHLIEKDSHSTDALLHHKNFVRAAHVALTTCFDEAHRREAARLFLAAVKKDDDFAWSGPLIDLLSLLPAAEVRPIFREQWTNLGLRDALLLRLADKPEEVDRERFLTGLESGQREVVLACLNALAELPRDETPNHLAPLVRLLRQLTLEPKEGKVRMQASALLNRQSGQSFTPTEQGDDPVALKRVYQPVFAWFDMQYPKWAAAAQGDADEDPAVWTKLLQTVPWDQGNAGRGEALFRSRACATCHTGSTRLGPDLTAVTSRFSRADLVDAIIYPSRDVAPPYRVTRIETHTGQVYYGIVAFFSADGVILQTGAATTVRLATPDIASQSPSTRSLMPNGLLKGLKPEDLADLYCYLQTLKPSK
jgi:putative heme-binding domain-containing protein